jgi:hypothetical protein
MLSAVALSIVRSFGLRKGCQGSENWIAPDQPRKCAQRDGFVVVKTTLFG